MPENQNITLPKWPFLAGDIVLIILACFIVIASPKPMPAIGIFASALSVILGMLVYVTPFIVDHLTQQQRIRLKQVKAEETLLRTVELASDLLNRTETIHSELMKGVLTIKQVPNKLDEKAKELMEIIDTSKLSTAVSELSNLLERMETRKSSFTSDSEKQIDISEIIKTVESQNSKLETKINSLHNEFGSELGKLRHDIQEKLIEAEHNQISTEIESFKDEPSEELKPDFHPTQQMVEHNQNPKPLGKPDPDHEENEESIFTNADNEIEAGELSQRAKENEENPSATSIVTSSRQNDDGATRLLVGAFIGISNKLYIRGEGPGLDWDKGVPMELVGIGKWEWKTYDANATVRCKVLINDEQWTDSENIDIDANTTVETTASF